MEIYLIRHTTPAIERGVCYGFSDIDLAESFEEEAQQVALQLPHRSFRVISSPLQRCTKLARRLFKQAPLTDERWKELNFGDWELQHWNQIDKDALTRWMQHFVHQRVPGGESYLDLQTRCIAAFQEVLDQKQDTVIITHGGVIRTLLSHVNQLPLEQSFTTRVDYGAVVHLQAIGKNITIQSVVYSQTPPAPFSKGRS